jgi:hypothetical protein
MLDLRGRLYCTRGFATRAVLITVVDTEYKVGKSTNPMLREERRKKLEGAETGECEECTSGECGECGWGGHPWCKWKWNWNWEEVHEMEN